MNHIPILVDEVMDMLIPQQGDFFIDGTLGGGGHSREIIKKITPEGILLGVDWDKNAIEEFKKEERSYKKVKIVSHHGNYANMPQILQKNKLPKAQGLLIDLGMSSLQLEESGRGFSFLKDEPLDMRYNKEDENGITASDIVNGCNKRELEKIIMEYGEDGNANRISSQIVRERKKGKIKTTRELTQLICDVVPKYGRINPATKTFMALRIYINRELENLKELLANLPNVMESGGRVAIISFHSLEDRIVKHHFRERSHEGEVKIKTKKPIIATEKERYENPRSRSAKLRSIEIL
jgi:16S rRNA (cytosine1402-N4)-methyltransferase